MKIFIGEKDKVLCDIMRMKLLKETKIPLFEINSKSVGSQAIKPQIFTANNQRYLLFRFPEDELLKPAEIMAFAEAQGKPMLTLLEGRKAGEDDKLNEEFRKVFRPGEWTFVLDSESDKRVAIYHPWDLHGNVIGHSKRLLATNIVVLKETAQTIKDSIDSELSIARRDGEGLLPPDVIRSIVKGQAHDTELLIDTNGHYL